MTRATSILYQNTQQSHRPAEQPAHPTAANDVNTVASRLQPISGRIFAPGLGLSLQLNDVADEDGDAYIRSLRKELRYIIITTDLLIPGDGPPLANGALVIEGKLIEWVGPQDGLPSRYVDKALRTYVVPFLMPGLWDCHVHFIIPSPEDILQPAYMPFISSDQPSVGARLGRACWESLQRGYTSLRDVAGYGCEIAKAVDDGTIVGPNIYSSGACISQLAGHGDVFSWPAGDVLLNLGVGNVRPGHFANQVSCIVDGVDECRRAVRLQIRRGAKCIKVLASGGIMSSDDNPQYAQFSPEELAVIVEEARRMDRAVAAHVHGKAGIMAAVEAGVTTVEHASYADEECIKLIKEKNVIYVATAAIVQLLYETGGKGIPRKIWDKLKVVAPRHFESYKAAIQAGVTLALGTDSEPGANFAIEIEYAVKAGLSNLGAIRAATANGPLTVQGQVPKTGQLKVGYEADVLGLTANPVEDVKVLQNKDTIKWVWKGGKIFKGPGVGPWGEEDD